METIAGKDDFDATVSQNEVPAYSENLSFEGKKSFAYLPETLHSEGLDPEIKAKMLSLIEKLKADGHTVEEAKFPLLEYIVPTYYVLTMAEASSNLSRYDGVHYGYRSENATDLFTTYSKSRSEGFGTEVKRRIMLGTFVLSAGYYDAYYAKAQKVRRMIRDTTVNILKDHDYILLPTSPTTAFGIGEKIDDPIVMYLADIFTVQASLAGTPAISMPLGKHSSGLPFGIQLIANKFEEKELLAAADYMMENHAD
jgi:aspartyl-tRNA(Asn)/glutamyl-tRNA(Gln) amidotransferase subunit A